MLQKFKDNAIEAKPATSSTTSDGRYKTLFEQVNAAAFLTTLEGKILEANQKSCELFGYDWTEILRISLKDILPQEIDWIQFKDEIAARGGLNIETEGICKDGSFLPVELSISLFTIEKKPVMFVLLWDITERRKAQKKLKESEQKYRGLFEYATDGIFVLDARGNILDVNTKMCNLLDFTKDDFLNKNLFSMDLLTAKSSPVVIGQFEQLLQEKTATNYTTEIKDAHGTVLDAEISSFFLVRKDGEVDNFVLIIRDITARNEAEQRRLKEHELLMTLMDNTPDSVYFKDEQHRFILVNKAKAEHSNSSPEEMIGKTDFDFLPEEEARKINEDDTAILNTGRPIVNKIEKLTHPDGSIKWISVTKIPRYNAEGDITGTMGISRDITAQEKTKDDLMKSEERYRAVFENSSFAIILTDEQRRIVSWNKVVEDLLSMTYDDLHLKSVESLYPPDEWNKIQTEYQQQAGIKHRVETKIVRKDRRLVDVDLTVNVLKSRDGKILGSTEIIHDITRRKMTEKELETKHELLSILMDSIPDSVYFKDEYNKFILVNKAKAKHSNVSPEEMTGKTDFDFLQEEQAKEVFNDDNQVKETGQPIINKVEKLTGVDGGQRWISVTKIPRYNKKGTIIGTMGISRDITDWKKAEQASAEKHELLKTLMDNIPDSIYFKDEQNRFIFVNKAKADHWNVKPEDLIGKTDFDFLTETQAQKSFDDDNRILHGERIIDKIEKITGSDGLERWFSVIKVPRYDKEGNIIGSMGISRNVTEWKKLQDMKKEKIERSL